LNTLAASYTGGGTRFAAFRKDGEGMHRVNRNQLTRTLTVLFLMVGLSHPAFAGIFERVPTGRFEDTQIGRERVREIERQRASENKSYEAFFKRVMGDKTDGYPDLSGNTYGEKLKDVNAKLDKLTKELGADLVKDGRQNKNVIDLYNERDKLLAEILRKYEVAQPEPGSSELLFFTRPGPNELQEPYLWAIADLIPPNVRKEAKKLSDAIRKPGAKPEIRGAHQMVATLVAHGETTVAHLEVPLDTLASSTQVDDLVGEKSQARPNGGSLREVLESIDKSPALIEAGYTGHAGQDMANYLKIYADAQRNAGARLEALSLLHELDAALRPGGTPLAPREAIAILHAYRVFEIDMAEGRGPNISEIRFTRSLADSAKRGFKSPLHGFARLGDMSEQIFDYYVNPELARLAALGGTQGTAARVALRKKSMAERKSALFALDKDAHDRLFVNIVKRGGKERNGLIADRLSRLVEMDEAGRRELVGFIDENGDHVFGVKKKGDKTQKQTREDLRKWLDDDLVFTKKFKEEHEGEKGRKEREELEQQLCENCPDSPFNFCPRRG
jgi:hypothetical protein